MTGPTEEVGGARWRVELAQWSLTGGAVCQGGLVGVEDEAFAALGRLRCGPVAQGKDTQLCALGPAFLADGVGEPATDRTIVLGLPDDLAAGRVAAGSGRKFSDREHATVRDTELTGTLTAARSAHQGAAAKIAPR